MTRIFAEFQRLKQRPTTTRGQSSSPLAPQDPTKIKDLLDSAFLPAHAQYLLIWRPLLNFTFITSTNHLTAASIFSYWEPEVASHSTRGTASRPVLPVKARVCRSSSTGPKLRPARRV